MSPLLSKLVDEVLLGDMVNDGFVRAQHHPTDPLVILNYTPKAAYSDTWNEVTRRCRGLIYNEDSKRVLARPFEKFFNLSQLSEAEIPRHDFTVLEKMDGSLGILYEASDGWAVATRGSFASDQAKFATAWMRAGPLLNWRPVEGWTYLFEIIYPANRIVVDYGDRAELVLLDVINNETGRSIRRSEQTLLPHVRWPGGRALQYEGFAHLEHLLAAEQPNNSEGYVLLFEPGNFRAKVKHDEYVRLHRIVTGVSTKTVWEYLSQEKPMTELLDRVPDEFYNWLKGVEADLINQFNDISEATACDFEEVVDQLESRIVNRKEFAMIIQDHPQKDILFKLLDGRSVAESIWKRLKPTYERPFMTQPEDVA